MSKEREKASKFLGEIEIEESCTLCLKEWEGQQIKPWYSMLKRDDMVYTQIVKNYSANELYLPILKEFSEPDGVCYLFWLPEGSWWIRRL